MSEFHEGDLVEAVKTEIASSTRFRGILTLVENANGIKGLVLKAQGYEPMFQWLEDQGFEFTVIEKAAPPLPTEPGFYLNCRNELWTLEKNGSWRNDYDDPETPAAVFNSAPFTRLEPVPVTARRVLEAIDREYGENYLNNRDAGWNTVAAEFGVTAAEVQR